MDINELMANAPDVYQAVLKKGGDEREEAVKQQYIDQGEASGRLSERKRQADIDALGLPETFAKKAKESDWTAEQAAYQYTLADKERRDKVASDMKTDLNEGLESDVPDQPANPDKGEQEEEEAKTPEQEWEANADLRDEFGDDKDRYLSFVKANSAGKVKILQKGGK